MSSKKFIFIKTQKTASTSLELHLAKYIYDKSIITPQNPFEIDDQSENSAGFPAHCLASDLKYWIGDSNYKKFYSFAVERDPWEKTISLYHMYKSLDRDHTRSLDEFLEQGVYPINFPIYTDRFDHSKIIVDKLIRYENLSEELKVVFKKIDIPFNGKLEYSAKSDFRRDGKITKQSLSKKQFNKIGDAFNQEISLLGWYS